ncbi:F-box/LRR-repeat protein At3g59190-like isoform X2 [Miscanthus floridulus]|uniref:F-box/LRR-repeat protein At3g59190-like isoform X2 n=1 Tax=Miscanthus floridulus TaxID=154761 RepID=UPI00345A9311
MMDALPDGVLGHILGFLLAPEAVRTCVLARRWCQLWRFTTGLRVGCRHEDERAPVKEHREFLDHLLLRGGSALDFCEFGFTEFQDDDEPRVNLWFRHTIMCRVRVLKLHIFSMCYLELDDLPLVSQHLTRLDLHGVVLHSSFLNFSSCPALEHLELVECGFLTANKISSKSLKHLSLTNCFLDVFSHVYIYTPLVSLRLDDLQGMTPILDIVPSLVKTFVRITEECEDVCAKLLHPEILDCVCQWCVSSKNIDGSGSSVLLRGLSQAKSLVLISELDKVVFKSDLRWCPVFNNLKALFLNDYWCTPDDFNALVCILEHSPVLEKLTLELFCEGPKYKIEMKGSFNLRERSAKISEHLSIVEVKCQDVDERVLKVLKFLPTINIYRAS